MLDRLRSKKRLRIGRTFHLTEFGYQTSPPDPAVGIALALQTRYLQQAAYVAWKYKRVRGLSFYQWDDEPVVNRGSGTKRYSGWQTGLRFNNGRPKPVLSTIPGAVRDRPAREGARRALLWGQVRAGRRAEVDGADPPARRGRLPDAGAGADRRRRHLDVPASLTTGAQYRYRWTPLPTLEDPNPRPRVSGIVDLGRRETQPRTRPRWRSEGAATIPRRSTPRATRSPTARRA